MCNKCKRPEFTAHVTEEELHADSFCSRAQSLQGAWASWNPGLSGLADHSAPFFCALSRYWLELLAGLIVIPQEWKPLLFLKRKQSWLLWKVPQLSKTWPALRTGPDACVWDAHYRAPTGSSCGGVGTRDSPFRAASGMRTSSGPSWFHTSRATLLGELYKCLF